MSPGVSKWLPESLRDLLRPNSVRRSHDGSDDFGLEHAPGDPHHRAYVGPPADYDLIAGLTFSLLFASGLRETDNLLDLGCGSLRVGRLLMPYLRPDRYCGIEPNKWLVQAALAREVGRDVIRLKRPRFSADEDFDASVFGQKFDWMVAQSIFSHTYADMTRRALANLAPALSTQGALIGTVLQGSPTTGSGWLYPGCVTYQWEEFENLLESAGLSGALLAWPHPRQSWFVAGIDDEVVKHVQTRVDRWPQS